LQQYGSIVGHGAYLGPDYTAEYLRLSSEHIRESLASQGVQDPQAATSEMLRTNRYDPETGTLIYTDEQIAAFEEIRDHYAEFFGVDTTEHGLLPSKITDPDEIEALTAFFAWTAWASAADRPGQDYSYTNNWPPEPRVDNQPSADILVWSAMSLVALLAGLGILFAVYGRWSRSIGWKGSESPSLAFLQPGQVGISKAQKATAWFFLVVSVLFFLQATLGAAVEHYRVELSGFFGLDLAQLLPFNLSRTCMSSCPCSGRPQRSWPPRSSWRPSSPAASRSGSTGWPTGCSGPWPWWWAACSSAQRSASSVPSGPAGRSSSISSGSTWTCPGSGRSSW